MNYKLIILIIIILAFITYRQIQKSKNAQTINPNKIKQGPIVHTELSDDQLKKVKKIHSTFSDVYTISLEETITNFKRDRNPDNEIEIWLNMVNAYEKFVLKDSEITLNKKIEVFRLILRRSMMDEEKAMKPTDLNILSKTEITEIFTYYALEPKPLLIEQKP